ncbi:MAG: hypothetical protein ACRD5H_15040 [Nitrososphaerales archaeon]
MPEIVKKTGINRKAWNQRFSRLERKLMVTNRNSEIINGDNNENVTSRASSHNKTNKFLAALVVIGFMLTIYFIYMEIKKGRDNSKKLERKRMS